MMASLVLVSELAPGKASLIVALSKIMAFDPFASAANLEPTAWAILFASQWKGDVCMIIIRVQTSSVPSYSTIARLDYHGYGNLLAHS